MNRCQKCNVRISDDTEVCPLCRFVVEPEGENVPRAAYPDIRLMGKKLELAGRIMLFLSIVCGAGALLYNYMHQDGGWWSVVVIGGLAYALLIMFFMVENEHAGYRSKVMLGVACGIAYLIIIDYVFGFQRWSLNYVVPASVLAMDVLIIILMLVNLRSWQSYLLFQIFMILCSGVCVLLYYAGAVKRPLLSFVALGCSAVLFLATFIIGGRRASNELKRRFHVM